MKYLAKTPLLNTHLFPFLLLVFTLTLSSYFISFNKFYIHKNASLRYFRTQLHLIHHRAILLDGFKLVELFQQIPAKAKRISVLLAASSPRSQWLHEADFYLSRLWPRTLVFWGAYTTGYPLVIGHAISLFRDISAISSPYSVAVDLWSVSTTRPPTHRPTTHLQRNKLSIQEFTSRRFHCSE